MSKEPNIFEILNNTLEIAKSHRENLSEEDKKKFDKEYKEANIEASIEDFKKQLNNLPNQLENALKGFK